MASIIEELIAIMSETTECYREFLELADNKKEVIINGNMPSLQILTSKEQVVAGRLLRLESKRKEVMEDICIVANKDSQKVTMAELIEMLDGQAEQAQLKQASQQLVEVVEQVREINQLNSALLNESLDYINFTMNLINSSQNLTIGNNYEKKGTFQGEEERNNFFDAKQ